MRERFLHTTDFSRVHRASSLRAKRGNPVVTPVRRATLNPRGGARPTAYGSSQETYSLPQDRRCIGLPLTPALSREGRGRRNNASVFPSPLAGEG